MSKKPEKKIDLNNIKPEEEMKYEIAKELGYLDKVMATGWKSLTAKESGRIGGIITRRKRELRKQSEAEESEHYGYRLVAPANDIEDIDNIIRN
jgi:hypothetical protein